MNVLTIFEQRIGAIFENGAPGERLPFSFKRLAKRAVREMEDETFVIDGVDTAPALYTILVSAKDDYLMSPMYVRITNEISQLIEAQAKKRGYTFVGKPLVRFMVDPALRRGRFSVFAENIDPRTLARLRDEENAYLGITPPREIYVEQGFVPESVPTHEDEPEPVAREVAFAGNNLSPVEDFVSDLEAFDQDDPFGMPDDADAFDAPAANKTPAGNSYGNAFDDAFEDAEPSAPFVPPFVASGASLDAAPDPSVPSLWQDEEQASEVPQQAGDALPACTLTNLTTGQTFAIDSERVPVGRESAPGAVVVRDPNASRRHAEIVYSHGTWVVRDLNSTNGTLVNDMEVQEMPLHDGDVLTIGLTNLEFRAGGR